MKLIQLKDVEVDSTETAENTLTALRIVKLASENKRICLYIGDFACLMVLDNFLTFGTLVLDRATLQTGLNATIRGCQIYVSGPSWLYYTPPGCVYIPDDNEVIDKKYPIPRKDFREGVKFIGEAYSSANKENIAKKKVIQFLSSLKEVEICDFFAREVQEEYALSSFKDEYPAMREEIKKLLLL